MIGELNAPPSPPMERRGSTGSPAGPSSLLFFGGIVVAIALLGGGALAIWGPEKDVSGKAAKLATDPPPADSGPSLPPEPAASETIAPPVDPPPEPEPEPAPVEKKGKKKGGGKKRR